MILASGLLHLRKTTNWLFDQVIAPPFCAYCKIFMAQRTIFCETCLSKIHPIVSSKLAITKSLSVPVIAISAYEEPLRSLIIAKSWSDQIASKHLGELIWQMTPFKYIPCDFLVPVPLHWTRYARRGFNQAHTIAQVLATKRDIPVADVIQRRKRTPFQSSLPVIDRYASVSDAFSLAKIDHALYYNKHIVIVDDLMTTGSTVKALSRALLALKPASLRVIVACRMI